MYVYLAKPLLKWSQFLQAIDFLTFHATTINGLY